MILFLNSLGQLAPNTVDGHLHLEIPIGKMGHFVHNIRSEHELHKEKRANFSFTITTKMCLDTCKLNSTGSYDCMYESYYKKREQCELFKNKQLVKLENVQIEKLEHSYKTIKDNLVMKDQEFTTD